ncbi:unnamed protein product [Dicrocoelium dendriticum]|nr:unnamed protein product [Dicrocoelium dendriticum]
MRQVPISSESEMKAIVPTRTLNARADSLLVVLSILYKIGRCLSASSVEKAQLMMRSLSFSLVFMVALVSLCALAQWDDDWDKRQWDDDWDKREGSKSTVKPKQGDTEQKSSERPRKSNDDDSDKRRYGGGWNRGGHRGGRW